MSQLQKRILIGVHFVRNCQVSGQYNLMVITYVNVKNAGPIGIEWDERASCVPTQLLEEKDTPNFKIILRCC